METVRVNSITRLRIRCDGEGVRSVVFLHGCPLDCFWCCNPEIRAGDDYRTLTAEQLWRHLERDLPYFLSSGGGITFSGGEPLVWGAFLEEFIPQYCQGFSVDLETSLDASWHRVENLTPLVNQWCVDFKQADPEMHRQFTGSTNDRILQNLTQLANRIPGERILITWPVIPGYNDSDENIRAMIDWLNRLGLKRIELHPYRKIAEEKQRSTGRTPVEVKELTPERRRQLEQRLREAGLTPETRKSPYGKEKCEYLKALRRSFCEAHNWNVEILECPVTEGCIGTCPRCEYELDEIGKMLQTGRKENHV